MVDSSNSKFDTMYNRQKLKAEIAALNLKITEELMSLNGDAYHPKHSPITWSDTLAELYADRDSKVLENGLLLPPEQNRIYRNWDLIEATWLDHPDWEEQDLLQVLEPKMLTIDNTKSSRIQAFYRAYNRAFPDYKKSNVKDIDYNAAVLRKVLEDSGIDLETNANTLSPQDFNEIKNKTIPQLRCKKTKWAKHAAFGRAWREVRGSVSFKRTTFAKLLLEIIRNSGVVGKAELQVKFFKESELNLSAAQKQFYRCYKLLQNQGCIVEWVEGYNSADDPYGLVYKYSANKLVKFVREFVNPKS